MQTIRQTIRSWTGDNNDNNKRPASKASRSSSKVSTGRYKDLQSARSDALQQQVQDTNAIAWLGGDTHETFRSALKRAEVEISLRRQDARSLCDDIANLFARFINTDNLPEEKQYEVAGIKRDILLGLEHIIRAAETAQINEISRAKDILGGIHHNISRAPPTRQSTQSLGDHPVSLKYSDEEQEPDKPDQRRRDSSLQKTPPDASASQPTMSFWENDGSTPGRPIEQPVRPVDEGIGMTVIDGEAAKIKTSPENISSSSPGSQTKAPQASQEPSRLQPLPTETSQMEGSESTEERTQNWLGQTRQRNFTPEASSKASSHGWPQDVNDNLADLMPAKDVHDFSDFHTRGQPAPTQGHREEQTEHNEYSSIDLNTPKEAQIQPPPPAVLANPTNMRPKEVPGPGIPIPSAESASSSLERPSARRQRREAAQKSGVITFLPGSTTPEEGSDGSPVSSPEPVYLDSNRLQWYQHILEAGDNEEYEELRGLLPPPEQDTSTDTTTMPNLGGTDDQPPVPNSTRGQRLTDDTTLLGLENSSLTQDEVTTTEASDFALTAVSEHAVASSDDPALGPFRAVPSWELFPTSSYTMPRRSSLNGETVGLSEKDSGSSLISIGRGFLRRRKEAWLELLWLVVTSLYAQMLKVFSMFFQVVQNVCVRFDIWLDPPFPKITVSSLSPGSQMVLATDLWVLTALFTVETYIAVTRERRIWRQANGLTRMYFLDLVREDPPWSLLPRVDTRLMVGWKDVFHLMLGGWLPLHSARTSRW